jgi:hypothetical protein
VREPRERGVASCELAGLGTGHAAVRQVEPLELGSEPACGERREQLAHRSMLVSGRVHEAKELKSRELRAPEPRDHGVPRRVVEEVEIDAELPEEWPRPQQRMGERPALDLELLERGQADDGGRELVTIDTESQQLWKHEVARDVV